MPKKTALVPVAPRLDLFAVTLDWNTNNREEGDYANSVWAENDEAAVRLIAEEMSFTASACTQTKKARAAFVEAAIESASVYAAVRIADTALNDVERLIAGPNAEMSDEAKADLEAVRAIMKKYGVV